MYNVDKADHLLKRKLEKDPNYTKKLLEKIREENPEQFERTLMEDTYGRHIGDIDAYQEAVNNLKWTNGKGRGEKWDKDDLLRRSGIDFNQEPYTEFDWLYAVQSLYSDYGNISEDPKYYMSMARDYLNNNSYYPEKGSERAYYDAQRRSRRNNYNYRNRYDGYGYNNYGNYGNYSNYDYNYENRYNERNTYRDRDNDGKYRE